MLLYAGAAAVGAPDVAAAHAVRTGLQLSNFVSAGGLRVPTTAALAMGTHNGPGPAALTTDLALW